MNLSDSRFVPGADAELSRPAQRDVSARTAFVWHSDAQVRAAHLIDTLAAADRAALVPVLVAIGLFAFFWSSADRLYAGGLMLVTTFGAMGACIAARLDICRRPRPRGVNIGLRVVVAFAAVTGCAWGTMPIVLFSGAGADQRLIVVAAIAAVMANACWLGPVRFVALTYLGPICLGSALGFALGESPAAYALAGAVWFYGWCLPVSLHETEHRERSSCRRSHQHYRAERHDPRAASGFRRQRQRLALADRRSGTPVEHLRECRTTVAN